MTSEDPKPLRAAVYIGPSDGSLRLAAVKEARTRNGEVIATFEAQRADQIPLARDQVVVKAHGGFDLLVVSRLSALGTDAMDALGVIAQLTQLNVPTISVSESWLADAAQAIEHVYGWIQGEQAQAKSAAIRESLAKARREGRHVGRPRVSVDTRQALDLLKTMPLSKVAARLGIGATTLRRKLQEAGLEARGVAA
jgi:hypothetical protein